MPAWWRDAKLGIFVHWTPASVAAFAPTDDEIGALVAAGRPDALGWSPYAEWYENSLRFPESPAARHHREHYGDRPYRDFAADWERGLETWDPESWAAAFAATGARYVVMVTKHHDGYCLWPSDVPNPHAPELRSKRDVVGELATAVRAVGLRFGVYYSGGLDWTFNDHPIGAMTDLLAAQPRGDYPAYAEAQVRELIERYQPSVLWNDISWPDTVGALARVLDHYYRVVPDGVINDRFMPWSPLWAVAATTPVRKTLNAVLSKASANEGGIVPPKPPLFDVRTPEYTVFPDVQPTPWECVRGMDKSFGHNEASDPEHFLAHDDLLWTVCDIASKNGNLLLNVGPRGRDAQIAPAQLDRLQWLAEFCGPGTAASVALRGSRPWIVPAAETDSLELRFTARDESVFVFARHRAGTPTTQVVVVHDIAATPTTSVHAVDGTALPFEIAPDGSLSITMPAILDATVPAVVECRNVVAAKR